MNTKYLIMICSLIISAYSFEVINADLNSKNALLVHKTPTCRCCKKWVEHLKINGLNVETKDHQNLDNIKKIMR